MGTLHDIESGAQIHRSGFGEFLDAKIGGGWGVMWDKLSQPRRRIAATVAAVALGAVSGGVISAYHFNRDKMDDPTEKAILCFPETTFTAEAGDTLSQKGEDRLVALGDAAREQGAHIGNPSGAKVMEYQLENARLNGGEGTATDTEHKLGEVCIVTAQDGTPEYAVVSSALVEK